jgi:hypothetical protein
MSEEEFTAERALFDDLGGLDEPSTTARLTAAQGYSGADLRSFLERLEREDTDEPFWRGVHRLEANRKHVELAWNDPIDPRLLPVDNVQVECHLYDPEALEAAERARDEREAAPTETAPELPTA